MNPHVRLNSLINDKAQKGLIWALVLGLMIPGGSLAQVQKPEVVNPEEQTKFDFESEKPEGLSFIEKVKAYFSSEEPSQSQEEPLALSTGDEESDTNLKAELGDVSGVGAYGTGTSFVIPGGHNGLAPSISFSYSTMAPQRLSGYGWDLSADYFVERDINLSLSLTWEDEDYFRIQSPGASKGNLVFIRNDSTSSKKVYVPELISGRPSPVILENNKFTMISSDGGAKYYFDKPLTNSCAGTSKTLRWYLTKVEDAYGNKVEYTWDLNESCSSSTRRFEPLLDSIAYAHNGSNYYKVKFNYVTDSHGATWDPIENIFVSGSGTGETFQLISNEKLGSIEHYLCTSSGCGTPQRTLWVQYKNQGSNRKLVYVDKIYHCPTGSITSSNVDTTCLPPTRFEYFNKVQNGPDTTDYRLSRKLLPSGGAETITYAYLKDNGNDDGVARFTTSPDPGREDEFNGSDPGTVVATSKVLCDDWNGSSCSGNPYETRFYYTDPYYHTISDYGEYRGAEWFETRQVNPGSDTRISNGQTTLVRTNLGRRDIDDPRLKGVTTESYAFNNSFSSSGDALPYISSKAIQRVKSAPEPSYIFCADEVQGTVLDCSATIPDCAVSGRCNGHSTVSVVETPGSRTDVYDQDGEYCGSDNCHQTVIQMSSIRVNDYRDQDLHRVFDDTLDPYMVRFFRCDGDIDEALDITNENNVAAACPTSTSVRFAYTEDPTDPTIRKLYQTNVYSSQSHSYIARAEYQALSGGKLGNPTTQYIGYSQSSSGDDEAQAYTEAGADYEAPVIEGHPVVHIRQVNSGGLEPQTVPAWWAEIINNSREILLSLLKDLMADTSFETVLYVASTTTYNARGIATESKSCFNEDCTDSLKTKTTAFDSTLALYPTTVQAQYDRGTVTTTTSYDVARGLVSNSTASTSGVGSYTQYLTYDTYGRVTTSGDSQKNPNKWIFYDDADYKYVKTAAAIDSTANCATSTAGCAIGVDHYDGLGRVIYKVAGPAKAGTTSGYIATAQGFNQLGQTIKTWHPQFVNASDPTAVSSFESVIPRNLSQDCTVDQAPSDSTLDLFCTEIGYDPLGRQNKAKAADGSETESKIAGANVAVIGPDVMKAQSVAAFSTGLGGEVATHLGHVQTRYDGFGNPIEVREYCNELYCGTTYSDTSVIWRPDSRDDFINYNDETWYAATSPDEEGVYRGTSYEYEYRAKPDGSGVEALVTLIRDVRGNVTTFKYDDLGRRVEMVDPDAGTTAYVYQDPSGQLVEQTDARGVVAEFSYLKGQLQSATYTGDTVETVTNTYGELSGNCSSDYTYPNMLSKSVTSIDGENSYETRYCFDKRGRVVERKYIFGFSGEYASAAESSTTKEVDYTWTEAGQTSTIVTSGCTLTYSYCTSSNSDCSAGQLIKISGTGTCDPDGSATDNDFVDKIAYDAKGQMVGVWLGNGRYTYYSYYPKNLRLEKIETCSYTTESSVTSCVSSGKPTIQNLRYYYRAGGDIYQIDSSPTEPVDVDGDGQEDLVSNATITLYEYDGLDRLIEAEAKLVNQAGAPCLYHQKYSYDTIGNMRTKQELCNREDEATKYTWTFNYDTNGPHQLSSVALNNPWDGEDGSCSIDVSYDEAGNTLTNCNPHNGWHREMLWTPRGQMEGVSYAPGDRSSLENYLESLYNHLNLRYFKFQSDSVKDGWDTSNPSYTVYIDKLFEFGVRDMNTDLTGPLDQQAFSQIHVFMGGVDPATGDIAPGTRRIATIDVE